MKSVLTIIKKELKRFFGDKRLVFTTVIMPGLTIFLVYTLMGSLFQDQFSVGDDFVAKCYAENLPDEIKGIKAPIDWLSWDGSDAEEKLKEIENGDADLVVYFPEEFWSEATAHKAGEGAAPSVEIYYDSSKTNSAAAYELMTGFLDLCEEKNGERI